MHCSYDHEMPYFLTNPEWYTRPEEDIFFEDGRGYHLTELAPQEAIDSYNAVYGTPEDGERHYN